AANKPMAIVSLPDRPRTRRRSADSTDVRQAKPKKYAADLAMKLQEAIEHLATGLVEPAQVADQVLHTVRVGDQQRGLADAADVFLALEYQCGGTAVGFYLPGAWRRVGRHVRDARDLGQEFAARKFFRDQRACRLRYFGQT